jgi:hypothetical protein
MLPLVSTTDAIPLSTLYPVARRFRSEYREPAAERSVIGRLFVPRLVSFHIGIVLERDPAKAGYGGSEPAGQRAPGHETSGMVTALLAAGAGTAAASGSGLDAITTSHASDHHIK